jgi:hypothetical protein
MSWHLANAFGVCPFHTEPSFINASEEFLGQSDDDARRASHVAEPVLVLVDDDADMVHSLDRHVPRLARACATVQTTFLLPRLCTKSRKRCHDLVPWNFTFEAK